MSLNGTQMTLIYILLAYLLCILVNSITLQTCRWLYACVCLLMWYTGHTSAFSSFLSIGIIRRCHGKDTHVYVCMYAQKPGNSLEVRWKCNKDVNNDIIELVCCMFLDWIKQYIPTPVRLPQLTQLARIQKLSDGLKIVQLNVTRELQWCFGIIEASLPWPSIMPQITMFNVQCTFLASTH